MKTTEVKISETRFPKLTRSVIRQTGRENLEDIARHGADGGFAGFTYYADTVSFFRRNRREIIKLVNSLADELGEDFFAMIAAFRCLKDDKLTTWEISEAINSRGEHATTVQNALAWFAAEEIAREMNPDI